MQRSSLPGKISRLPVSLFHQARLLNLHAVKCIHTNIHLKCVHARRSHSALLTLLPCPAEEIRRLAAAAASSSLNNTHYNAKSPITAGKAKWRAMKASYHEHIRPLS